MLVKKRKRERAQPGEEERGIREEAMKSGVEQSSGSERGDGERGESLHPK